MTKNERSTSSKFRALVIAATCLGLMAVGASSASAAETTTYKITAVASHMIIQSGNYGGKTVCETLTATGQATAPNVAGATKTGTVTSLTSSNCVEAKWSFPMVATLKTPWTVSVNAAGETTLGNVNIHMAVNPNPKSPCEYDMKENASRTFRSATSWPFLSNPWTVSGVYSSCSTSGFAENGPGYLQGGFNVTYTKVS